MTLKDFGMNIITLGAHGRVQKAVKSYDNRIDELRDLHEHHELRKTEVNKMLEQVIVIKKIAVLELQKVKAITSLLNIKQRKEIEQSFGDKSYTFDQIEGSISAGEMALNAAKGVGTGISTALGAWALVGTLGVASTGTAIGTLSGAAASNAILAWLGGGSIVAGGGGIAVGTLALGGIVAIPALAITGIFQHLSANKEINRVKEREIEVIKAIGEIKTNLVAFDAVERRSMELIESLTKALEGFQVIYRNVKRAIFPFGWISKVAKSIKKIFTKKYFSKKDLVQIQVLGNSTGNVLKIVDTSVIGV